MTIRSVDTKMDHQLLPHFCVAVVVYSLNKNNQTFIFPPSFCWSSENILLCIVLYKHWKLQCQPLSNQLVLYESHIIKPTIRFSVWAQNLFEISLNLIFAANIVNKLRLPVLKQPHHKFLEISAVSSCTDLMVLHISSNRHVSLPWEEEKAQTFGVFFGGTLSTSKWPNVSNAYRETEETRRGRCF